MCSTAGNDVSVDDITIVCSTAGNDVDTTCTSGQVLFEGGYFNSTFYKSVVQLILRVWVNEL